MLAQRAAKRSRLDDFQRYINIPNDPCIPSALAYWKVHKDSFPDLARMARDTLPIPASGCSVERLFSVSGRVATWQRSHLCDSTIADIMIYKASLNFEEVAPELED